MQRRLWLKRFGIRFGISLVVLGTIYGLIFGFSLHRKRPLTTSQKVVVLRTALDQTLIDSNTLLHYSGQNATSADVLTALNSQLNGDSTKLQTALKQAPSTVKSSLRSSIQAVIKAQMAENNAFSKASKVLLKPIAYDPESDLGNLDLNHNRDELLTRATGAQNGLKTAATNTTLMDSSANSLGLAQPGQNPAAAVTVVSSSTKANLLTSAKCFGQLVTELQANQVAKAGQTRTSCIQNYPAIRVTVIENLLQDSLSPDYKAALKTTVPDLLKQLDVIIKTNP